MVVKTCPLCQKTFTAKNPKTIFCSNPHQVECFHCGKKMLRTPRSTAPRYACSATACRAEAIRLTSWERYGVDNPSKTPTVKEKLKRKKSERSDEERQEALAKTKATMKERYGVEHALQAPEVKAAMKRTVQERYGVDNVAQAKEVKEHTKHTNLKKYGVECSFQAEEVKAKIKETNLDRYGKEHPLQNTAVRARARKTNLEKYGHENPATSPEVKARARGTALEKYGVPSSLLAPEVQAKIKETNLARYGVENPAQSEEVKAKMRATCEERYGVDNVMKHEGFQKQQQEKLLEKYGVTNPAELTVKNYDDYKNLAAFIDENPMTAKELASYFNVSAQSVLRRARLLDTDEKILGRYATSLEEAAFDRFLKASGFTGQYTRNDRSVLQGKELDFYFPAQKLAVELSPTSTHNALTGWNGGQPKAKDYHKEKFLKCASQGLDLITVFDWHARDKVQEMVIAKLQASPVRIPARKCEVEVVAKRDKALDALLDAWHILDAPRKLTGFRGYTVLKYEGDLVGIALWVNTKEPKQVELKRMVFKPQVSVVGGASRLIKAYTRKQGAVEEVLTFSDCDLGRGEVYARLGFTLVQESSPQVNYHNPKTGQTLKHLSLVKQGADRLLRKHPSYVPVGVGEGLPSNKEIVQAYGFLPVYDCGYRKWLLRLES